MTNLTKIEGFSRVGLLSPAGAKWWAQAKAEVEQAVTNSARSVDGFASDIADLQTETQQLAQANGSLQAKINAANASIATNATNIASVTSTANATSNTVAALSPKVKANTDAIAALQSKTTASTANVSDLQAVTDSTSTTLTSLQAKVAADSASITALQSQTSALSASVSSAQAKNTSQDSAISALQSSDSSQAASIKALQTQAGAFATSASVSAQVATIAALQTQVAQATGYAKQNVSGSQTITVTSGALDVTATADSTLTLNATNGWKLTILARTAGHQLTINGVINNTGASSPVVMKTPTVLTLVKASDGCHVTSIN